MISIYGWTIYTNSEWISIQSVDNYVARADGSIDWIESRLEGKNDLGMAKFKENMDALILGRKTYEKIVGEFKVWPFKPHMPVYVLSRQREMKFPKYIPKNVRHSAECPRHIIRRLDAEDEIEHVWVDGMYTIAQFLKDGCLDDIVINRFPVLLGSGIPLFNVNMDSTEMRLRMKVSKIGKFGVVQTQYHVISNEKKGEGDEER